MPLKGRCFPLVMAVSLVVMTTIAKAQVRQARKVDSMQEITNRLDFQITNKTLRNMRYNSSHFHQRVAQAATRQTAKLEDEKLLAEQRFEELGFKIMEDTDEYLNYQPFRQINDTNFEQSTTNADLELIKWASENFQQVQKLGKCETPPLRCIRVATQHPEAATLFPRCALLHQCGDDAGCCVSPGLSCVAVETHNVDLYFFAEQRSGVDSRVAVQRLTFQNHSKCDCRDISQEPFTPSSVRHQCTKHFHLLHVEEQPTCDCLPGDDKCRKFKRGKLLPASEAKCIEEGDCYSPVCEYGSYQAVKARCPKKKERGIYTVSRN